MKFLKSYKSIFFLIFLAILIQSCQSSIRFSSNKSIKTSKSIKNKEKNDKNSNIDKIYINDIDKNQIVEEAETWIGTPYKYGGNSREGVDCSALVYQVYLKAGETLPRTSQQQFEYAKQIDFVEKKPGDLLFFKNNSSISHVGIYVGDGYMIHASTKSGVIKQSIFESYFMKKLASVGRIEH